MENRSAAEFSRRLDRLSLKTGMPLRALAPRVNMSGSMLFAYRSGKQPISRKAWDKLRNAEVAAGLAPPEPTPGEVRESSARYSQPPPLYPPHAAPVSRGQHIPPAGRGVIAPHANFPTPSLPTTDQDVHAYMAHVLAAAGGDPRRLATLLETLQLHLEPWVRKWRSEQ